MINNRGFTLIELVVVSGILVAISGIIGGILYSTLRGSESTRSKTLVAQNGNYAISSISELVKRSKSVVAISNGEPTEDTEKNFVDCTGEPSGTHLSLMMPDNKKVLLTCNSEDSPGRLASSSAENTYYLTDQSLVTGTCAITCYQASSYSTPRVKIEFSLGRAKGDGGMIENTEELFHTQINIRNYNSP